jgi:hypothetical protein
LYEIELSNTDEKLNEDVEEKLVSFNNNEIESLNIVFIDGITVGDTTDLGEIALGMVKELHVKVK